VTAAAAIQRELRLVPECPACGRPAGPRETCPEGLCPYDQVLFNGSAERASSAPVLALADAARDAVAGVPGCKEQLRAALAAAEGPADPAAVARFVERRRAELAGEEAKAARKASAGEEAKFEAQVMEEVTAALQKLKAKRRLFYWRANAGGAWMGEQFVRSNRTGTPDLICCVRAVARLASGREVVVPVFLGLELKRPGGQQSPSQKKFEQDLRDQGGGFYAVATSAAEATTAVERAARLEDPRHG
jgi:hypothetical protein